MNPRFVVSLLLMLFFTATAMADMIGTARKVSGEVKYRKGGKGAYEGLSAGTRLPEGAWVKTGRNGWAELLLSDGSTFTLANGTELELAKLSVGSSKREGTMNLVQGKLRASVVKLAGKQTDIKVKSGTAVAGIKGTEFLMLSKGPANIFFGNEGNVTVTGIETPAQPLQPGTVTQTTRGYTPLEPVKVEPGTPLAQAKKEFEAATGGEPPAEWGGVDALPDIVARWNINYGHYLADAGRYDEALHVFQLALDLTAVQEVRADALLERGTVYARFLNNPEAALAEYLLILEVYPKLPQAEIALFTVGQIQQQLGIKEQAKLRFQQYLNDYPTGKFRSNAETILKMLEK